MLKLPAKRNNNMAHGVFASRGKAGLILVLLILLGGCATTGHGADPRDPLEGFNRKVYHFNEFMDGNVFDPMGRAYKAVTPDLLDQGITNFFSNMGDLSVIANDILQLKPQAVSDIARVVFNSTIGLLGFFDVSSHIGLPKHDEDLGQTLGVWGVGPGPYLIIPLLGPSTVRDAAGYAIDSIYANPITYLHDGALRAGLMTLHFIDFKADLLSTRELIGEAAVDPYEFTKNAYLSRRKNQVRDKTSSEVQFEEIMNE